MKKLLALLILAWSINPAQANVPCSVPFNLQNGQTADATQVMANYNAIIACLANAAIAGTNNDITSLTALATPISPTQGGTNTYTGGLSAGSANAQVLTSVTPTGFSLTAGKKVIFRSGFSNTAATTLNVAGSGAINIYRVTNAGAFPLVGGEIIVGTMVEVIHDGVQFQLVNSAIPVPVGASMDLRNNALPPGYLVEDGSCVSRTGPTAALFAVIGTSYVPTGPACAGTEFALPDSRGRFNAGLDSTGLRLTTAGSSCNGAVIGTGCGNQTFTLAQANLPNVTIDTAMNTNVVTITDTRIWQVPTGGAAGGAQAVVQANAVVSTVGINIPSGAITGALASDGSHAAGTGFTNYLSGGITMQIPTVALPPLIVGLRVIKY